MRTIYFILSLLCTAMGLTACNELDTGSRLEKISIEDALRQTTRNILIEDFTGQRCVNCPEAANQAAEIQHSFGTGRAIVVAIHGGPLAVSETDSPIGLANEQSQQLNEMFIPQNESYPQGRIDRSGSYCAYTAWMDRAVNRLLVQPGASISIEREGEVESEAESESRVKLRIKVVGSNSQTVLTRLHVWLTEDHIIAGQIVPDTGFDAYYVHSHVFRTALTPLEGEACTLSESEPQERTFTATLKSKWVLQNMHIVAFVCNDETGEVMQAEEIQVISNK